MRTWADVESRRNGEDAEHQRRVGSSLLTSGEITACASDDDLIDSLSVETFRSAERERVGKILQTMVTEAEDMGLYDIEPLPFRR